MTRPRPRLPDGCFRLNLGAEADSVAFIAGYRTAVRLPVRPATASPTLVPGRVPGEWVAADGAVLVSELGVAGARLWCSETHWARGGGPPGAPARTWGRRSP